MTKLKVEHIFKTFDGTPVVYDVSFGLDKGRILSLLGPSGCGKTTLLRIIAGLEKEDSGMISVDGQQMNHIPPNKRNIGLMFQDYALFPHKNVQENIMFGLTVNQKVSKKEAAAICNRLIHTVNLAGFEHKQVDTLSGGEKQRVALARSLAPSPSVLMLDEPLGSLDRALREKLLIDLRKILQDTGTTAVFVTHDQSEAFAVADTIGIMNQGRLVQIDTPEELYSQPATYFAARFLGYKNIVPAKIDETGIIVTPLGQFENIPCIKDVSHLLIKPEGIEIWDDQQNDHSGCLKKKGQVTSIIFKGNHYEVALFLHDEIHLNFYLPVRDRFFNIGDFLTIAIDPKYTHLLVDVF